MSRKLQLTFACGDYEIMRALKEGIVRPEGIELTVLTDMAPSPRHWRFLRGREFDIAEVSGSGYVAARDQDLPFRAIPVFPHRRFPLDQAPDAQAHMRANKHFGKIVLTM